MDGIQKKQIVELQLTQLELFLFLEMGYKK